jgi:hypothetical protein
VRLLLDQRGSRSPWLGVEPREQAPRREAAGAVVRLALADGTVLVRRVRIDGGYASANDPRVLFGLAGRAAPASVRVGWADGGMEEWDAPAVGRYTVLVRGSGRAVPR